jgi:hypothetical protein
MLFHLKVWGVFAILAVFAVTAVSTVLAGAAVSVVLSVVVAVRVEGLRNAVKDAASDLDILVVQGGDSVQNLTLLGVILFDYIQHAVRAAGQRSCIGNYLAGSSIDDYIIVLGR